VRHYATEGGEGIRPYIDDNNDDDDDDTYRSSPTCVYGSFELGI